MLARLRHQLKHGKLFRSFLGVGGMYMMGIPLGLVINIVLARQLGPAEFGQYVFVMSLLTLLALPVSGGLPQLLTREVARFSHAAEWSLYRGVVRAAHIWVLLVGAVVLAGFFLVKTAGLLPAESKWALLGIVIFLVPLQGLNSVRNGTIKGLGFPALAELPLQTIQPVLLLAGIGLLAITGALSAPSALWMQVAVTAGTFALASLLFLSVRPKASPGTRPVYRNAVWLKALLPFSLISLVGTFNAQIGIVLLGMLSSDEAVSALRVADRGAQLVALPLVLVNMVIGPQIVKASEKNDRKKLQRLVKDASRWMFLLALPVAFILIAFGKSIIGFAFGEAYIERSYLALFILVLGQIVSVALGPLGLLLSMTGNERLTLYGYLVSVLITFLLAVFLIPSYGHIGAAIAISGGVVVVKLISALFTVNVLRIRPGLI